MKALSSISGRFKSLLARSKQRRGGGIVVFAPNAWFPSMIAAPAIVAKVLAERGHVVDVVSCAGERKTCTVMDGMAPQEDRPVRRFCEACVPQSRDYLARYALTQHFDTDFLDDADRRLIDEMSGRIGDDPRAFVWDGIDIGILAAGNLSNILKRDLFAQMSDAHRDRLRLMVEDGLRWYVIANKIFDRLQPKQLVYYAEYYPEIIVGLVMSRRGVRVVPVTHSGLKGADFRKLQIIDQMPQVLEMSRRLPAWPAWRDLPLAPNEIRDICDDIVLRFSGNYLSFSPGLNQTRELADIVDALRPDCRTVVVFTSSDDEMNNTKMQRRLFGQPVDTSGELFRDQVAWLREIAEFVARTDHVQMIVRLHPRLASNNRSNATAEYQEQVDALTRVGCPRIHLVLPESPCSSYDLAQKADLVLTSWSTIGLECVRMGLPLLMAFRGQGIFPTDGFLNFYTDRQAYFDCITRGIQIEIEDVLQAFRFTNMYLCSTVVDLSDLVPSYEDPTLPPYATPRCADEIEGCVVRGETISSRRLEERRSAQTALSAREERAEFACAIRRMIHMMAFGEDRTPPRLRYVSTTLSSQRGDASSEEIVVTIENDTIEIACGQRRVVRQSKAIQTLGRFHEEIVSTYITTESVA